MNEPLTFNDLLARDGLDPAKVLVMRHRPRETLLNGRLDWLVSERPELFTTFQRAHVPRVEGQLLRADFLAAFIRDRPGLARFVCIYRRVGQRLVSRDAWRAVPEVAELIALGMNDGANWPSGQLFDLEPTDILARWSRRLVIEWTGGERSWSRWAARNRFTVAWIDEAAPAAAMPHWSELILDWAQLNSGLPAHWRSALAQWRGVYLITDISDGRRYVGSAYGTDNLLGRWLGYSASGHGGNRLLQDRDPNNFRFSILQRLSPDLPPDEVIAVEASWKTRLLSRTPHGLNNN